MPFRLWNRTKFAVERWLVRGPLHRVLLAALLIGLISIAGGALVLVWGTGFAALPEAVWWSFLRLSDPGYLGDDVGVANRIVSTALTVLGYVVFLGALVAIMTQWLNARMQKLESGLTPVVRDGHILILGWTNRTDAIVRELLLSQDRARRFLDHRGGHGFHVVVLADHVTAGFVQDLRDAVGPVWDERRVTIRSGSALRPEHLARVDAAHAAVILIPGADFNAGSARSDNQAIKTLLSLEALSVGEEHAPRVVAEVFETRKVHLARRAYRGDMEVVSSDGVVSRLLAHNVRHPGLSRVYEELLTHREGNEIYIREAEQLAGVELDELHGLFPEGVLMGLVRPSGRGFAPMLNAGPGTRVEEGDKLVVLAHQYEDAKPSGPSGEAPFDRNTPDPETDAGGRDPRRVLVLGWNHRVPALLAEFGTYEGERYEIQVGSKVPVARREELLRHVSIDNRSVAVEHLELDFTDPDDVHLLTPHDVDSVVFMGSDQMESEEEADARTLMGFLVIDELFRGRGREPTMILELLDPDNAGLLSGARGEVIISPLVLSHLLTQVALRPELQSVFEELFTVGGAEIMFRPMSRYAEPGRLRFDELERAAAALGETALGVRTRSTGRVLLNPPKETAWEEQGDVDLVILATLPGR